MNFWQRRKTYKAIKHVLHESRHARHMREDISSTAAIDKVLAGEQALKDAWKKKDGAAIDQAADELSQAVHAIYPPHRNPRIRENIEIFLVAISVAMAFRTFFIQPFRIPTGSMQPTLYGIIYEPQEKRGALDRWPLSFIPLALFGERYVEIKAKAGGRIEFHQEYTDDAFIIRIAGLPHIIHRGMPLNYELGQSVEKGAVLTGARKKLGDHIFVNRLWYNFFKPERGDVFVFSTRQIKHPDIRPDNYYIKRLVGLPEETISIAPPYLIANGEKITEPPPFELIAHGEGYHGYTLVGDTALPAYLRRESDTLALGKGEYLPFGDNTKASLDGRFFGAVRQESIVGPAIIVYWPFSKRWGWIR